MRRGKTGAETLAPQICEPGNPNARYTVLCVEIYVDSDDNTPVMAFRWFYKKSDLDKKLGADVDAKDELVLARSIHSTPLEYVPPSCASVPGSGWPNEALTTGDVLSLGAIGPFASTSEPPLVRHSCAGLA